MEMKTDEDNMVGKIREDVASLCSDLLVLKGLIQNGEDVEAGFQICRMVSMCDNICARLGTVEESRKGEPHITCIGGDTCSHPDEKGCAETTTIPLTVDCSGAMSCNTYTETRPCSTDGMIVERVIPTPPITPVPPVEPAPSIVSIPEEPCENVPVCEDAPKDDKEYSSLDAMPTETLVERLKELPPDVLAKVEELAKRMSNRWKQSKLRFEIWREKRHDDL